MFYIKEEDENGEYTKDGIRYSVRGVNRACTPNGDNVGYTFFESEEAMLAAWGLIKLPNEALMRRTTYDSRICPSWSSPD